jgi:hypothetical protein
MFHTDCVLGVVVQKGEKNKNANCAVELKGSITTILDAILVNNDHIIDLSVEVFF